MLPMRSMVLSKSKPWNMRWWKCSLSFASCRIFGWRSRRYSPGRDEEARRAAGRVADHVGRLRRRHLDHQPDDVARRAELAVLPGGGDLAEHVLVEVALGVAVLHRHCVEQVHDLGQQRRRRDGEARVLHVVRVGGVVAAERAQEREDVLADDGEHLRRREVLEARPAQVLVGAALWRPCPPGRCGAPSAS